MKPCTIINLAKNIHSVYTMLCQPILDEYSLLQPSFDIIMFLANNPGYCTAKDICKYRNMKTNVVSNHVEKLVSTGYLKRDSVEGDRRKIRLCFTDKAIPVIEKGKEIQQVFFNGITNNIPENEINDFIKVLKKIDKNTTVILGT